MVSKFPFKCKVHRYSLVLLSANAQLDAAVPAPVRLLLNTSLGGAAQVDP
jgi:hypothetical protein